ncbi:RagB/SusD family nutrient uptake outer membrane protein [Solitalea lacus]|uniref:RagB/SusD family nutrient uptake outer membrane protein n=1 Tax=Solitalea lacus TaxID=2911172 RepID=UPI001EDC6B40|nr:RagB/SusD family nutrient uptake outer membrane protein [Solitalea lacus]UKJ07143.1 RagB/SusD family nutrient uptake outer membrane protein [Solitalea lacus]
MKHTVKIMVLISLLLCSCTKEIIDKKPDKSQVVPTTLSDFQALLDNVLVFGVHYSGIAEVASGDYYLHAADFHALNGVPEKNAFLWQGQVWDGAPVVAEWNSFYEKVFYTNVVLDGLQAVAVSNSTQEAYNQVKGMALFYRATAFFHLAQLFAGPYGPTAPTDLGIPLRLNSDLNERSVRATLEQTYAQILTDLQEALRLLPAQFRTPYRPSKVAAYALLARVALVMGDYDKALQYADESLKLHGVLLDYNSINRAATFPVPKLNAEVILQATCGRYGSWERARGKVDSLLYKSYAANDIRRTAFFIVNSDGSVAFKGMYSGSLSLFTGLATDEQLLIRAECYARKGKAHEAVTDLNTLLVNRYKKGTFVPLTATDPDNVVELVLAERRKQLLFRGLRWMDLRRLNQEARFAITLKRTMDGLAYTLPPNDKRYVFPIPDYILAATGMPQNER